MNLFSRLFRQPQTPQPRSKRSFLYSVFLAAGLAIALLSYHDGSRSGLATGVIVATLCLLSNFTWRYLSVAVATLVAAIVFPAFLLIIGLVAVLAIMAISVSIDGFDLPDI